MIGYRVHGADDAEQTDAARTDAARPDDPPGWWDERTHLPGPAFWRTIVATESARCGRYLRPATVVLAEIVGLADIASSWDPTVAEKVAAGVGAVLRSGCRASDYVVRLTDDRFALLLTETDEIAAINMVERVREASARAGTLSGGVRVAFGWASPTGSVSLVDAIDRAEDRLRRDVLPR